MSDESTTYWNVLNPAVSLSFPPGTLVRFRQGSPLKHFCATNGSVNSAPFTYLNVIVGIVRDYVQLNKLQDPKNLAIVICSSYLYSVLGVQHFHISQLESIIDQHVFRGQQLRSYLGTFDNLYSDPVEVLFDKQFYKEVSRENLATYSDESYFIDEGLARIIDPAGKSSGMLEFGILLNMFSSYLGADPFVTKYCGVYCVSGSPLMTVMHSAYFHQDQLPEVLYTHCGKENTVNFDWSPNYIASFHSYRDLTIRVGFPSYVSESYQDKTFSFAKGSLLQKYISDKACIHLHAFDMYDIVMLIRDIVMKYNMFCVNNCLILLPSPELSKILGRKIIFLPELVELILPHLVPTSECRVQITVVRTRHIIEQNTGLPIDYQIQYEPPQEFIDFYKSNARENCNQKTFQFSQYMNFLSDYISDNMSAFTHPSNPSIINISGHSLQDILKVKVFHIEQMCHILSRVTWWPSLPFSWGRYQDVMADFSQDDEVSVCSRHTASDDSLSDSFSLCNFPLEIKPFPVSSISGDSSSSMSSTAIEELGLASVVRSEQAPPDLNKCETEKLVATTSEKGRDVRNIGCLVCKTPRTALNYCESCWKNMKLSICKLILSEL